jgi:ABC-2 type transport system permease protein
MYRFYSAFRKEGQILMRDVAGLIVLFLMPMLMVIILSLVQEFGWNAISKEPQMKVLFVNEDQDSLGTMIRRGLTQSHMFELVTKLDTVTVTSAVARQKVSKGDFQIGVIIPKNATKTIRRKIQIMITQFVSGIMMPMQNPFLDLRSNDSVDVVVFFDPAIRGTFKNAFMSSMREYSLKIESQMIFQNFNEQLGKMFPQYQARNNEYQETVKFSEVYPSGIKEEVIPTTTQHNVPSWAIFAMFFIVIPLTSSIIKEREEGSLIRLHTLPVNYLTIFMAKVGVYLVVCFVQFMLMILSGIFILPLFGMPALTTGPHYGSIIMMSLATSLAALGYGIMVGTIARTHQQAAAFGSVSVVILTALGGLWVPIYLMPDFMRTVATYSPLNWAHAGFLDIFLRNSSFIDLLPQMGKLLAFFVVTMGIAGIYRKLKPPIGS